MEQIISIVKDINLTKAGCCLLVNTQHINMKPPPIYCFYCEHVIFESRLKFLHYFITGDEPL